MVIVAFIIDLNVQSAFLSLTQFSVNVYNPLARPVTWPIRLPVNGTAYDVSDAGGKPVDCQVSMYDSSKYEMIHNQLCRQWHEIKTDGIPEDLEGPYSCSLVVLLCIIYTEDRYSAVKKHPSSWFLSFFLHIVHTYRFQVIKFK